MVRIAPGQIGTPRVSVESTEEDTNLWLREALDAVAMLGSTFQTEQASGTTPDTVFQAARQALLRVADFGAMGMASADEDGLDFDLTHVEPESLRSVVQKEIDHQIAEGTFGWALYQDRPIIVQGQYMGKSVLMHVLATPSKISGMFIAALDQETPFIPEMGGMVLSILMQNCAGVLESGLLYRELADHNVKLERTVIERTAELRESEKAALAASKAKGDFLANMSHEIRTPINGVLGMTGLLLETTLTAEQREFAEATQRSAKNLLMLINDLLDYSKIEAGSLTLEQVPMDLRLVIDDVGELLAPQAITKGIELAIRYVPGTERYFVADPGRIRQVITNLAGNAVKFTSEGHVLITVEPSSADMIRIAIQDTGIGIPQAAVERIFEKFEQADVSTTRKHGGTGLGLAICRELADLMGGWIDVESAEGEGSTFTVCLPLKPDPAADRRDMSSVAHGKRVLLASPSAIIRAVVRQQLIAHGAEVDIHAGPEEAQRAIIVAGPEAYSAVLIDHAYGNDTCVDFANALSRADPDNTPTVARLTPGHLPDRNDSQSPFAFDIAKPVLERRIVDLLQHLGCDLGKVSGASERDEAAILAEGRVLLVEDNAVNRMIAVKMLEKMGVEVTVAEDGSQAVDAVNEDTFDLILMDCQMPVMNGYDATIAIRELEKTQGGHTPIVALTASALESDKKRCMDSGMDDFVSKPLTVQELRAAVLGWLDRETSGSSA